MDASSVSPDDATLAQVVQVPSSRPQSASSVLPYQDKVTAWWRQGIRGTVIHQALVDTYGYAGSYSSIRRFLQQLNGAHLDVTFRVLVQSQKLARLTLSSVQNSRSINVI